MTSKSFLKNSLLVIMAADIFLAQANLALAADTGGYVGVQETITRYLCTPTPTPEEANNTFKINTYQTAAQKNQNQYDLYLCINRIYKFAIAIGSSIAVLFIVVAGYIYMSAEGSQEAVDKAKSILTSSIAAMVILFGGYVLLRAINPELIQFQSVQPPSVKVPIITGTGACTGCVDFGTEFAVNGTLQPGKNTFLQPALITKLSSLKSKDPNFRINEAYPPTVTHSDPCHNDGSCADIAYTGTMSSQNLNAFCQKAKDSRLSITNEYYNLNYTAQQIPACGAAKKYDTTTGGHLHVK
ncbi:MAG: pilin [Patescibacteria group bacterium]|nr:pilin [Patescibacteria group bacterium]